MSDHRIFEFVHILDTEELGEVELNVRARVRFFGSGEDADAESSVTDVWIDGDMGMLALYSINTPSSNQLPEATVRELENVAAERAFDALPMCWEPGTYVWAHGPKKGRKVEVLDAALLPGKVDWVLVTREKRGSSILDMHSEIVLVDRDELSVDGQDALVPCQGAPS